MKGFSLLELLAAMLIIVILTAISVPSLKHWWGYRQAEASMQQLESAITYAKFQALSRQQTLILCPTNDHVHCSDQWCVDYMVGVFKEGDVARRLKVFKGLKSTCLIWQGFPKRSSLVFTPYGYSNQQNGRFVLELKGRRIELVLNRAGRMRLTNLNPKK